MIVRLFLTIPIFCFVTFFSTSQTYQAFYKYEYVSDSAHLENRKSIKTILYSNASNSWFSSEGNFKRDSLGLLVKNGRVSPYDALNEMRSFNKMDGYRYTVSKEYSTKQTIRYENIATQKYQYVDNISFDWLISNETKLVLGYSCQKATLDFGGRSYEAWFTNEIPISDGPFLFQGLPGLIVLIQDAKNHHRFELVSFNKLGLTNQYYANDLYIKTTKMEFLRAKKRYLDNPDAFMESTGVTVLSENAPKINPWRGIMKNSIILREY